VGPRDGLQNETVVATAAKIELLDALSSTGLRRIEAVSFVHPAAIPQMADADEVWAGARHDPSVSYSALVPNVRGAQRALAAGFADLEVVISASNTHNLANVNRTTQESLDELSTLSDLVHQAGAALEGIVATAWGCPYEGDVPLERVVDVAADMIDRGVDSLAFGDTTGMATPVRVQRLVGAVRDRLPDAALLLHFHDTRGTALANVLAALQLGVTDYDASVGGLGGCPYAPGASGNVATEDVVHMLEDMGVATGVDLEALIDAARTAQALVGRELPSAVLRAGPRSRRTPIPAELARRLGQ
jgi:hydroxymethylglutaryl-CoA lyase